MDDDLSVFPTFIDEELEIELEIIRLPKEVLT
jgi:hypothetical protein